MNNISSELNQINSSKKHLPLVFLGFVLFFPFLDFVVWLGPVVKESKSSVVVFNVSGETSKVVSTSTFKVQQWYELC